MTSPPETPSSIIDSLFATIKERQAHPRANSYTTELFTKGIDEISKKVGEEAVEIVVAALNQNKERLVSELADLAYHTLVLMALKDVSLEEVYAELARRHR
jgi:phosphoribosyl-ATP pyrophosphohydrolase